MVPLNLGNRRFALKGSVLIRVSVTNLFWREQLIVTPMYSTTMHNPHGYSGLDQPNSVRNWLD